MPLKGPENGLSDRINRAACPKKTASSPAASRKRQLEEAQGQLDAALTFCYKVRRSAVWLSTRSSAKIMFLLASRFTLCSRALTLPARTRFRSWKR